MIAALSLNGVPVLIGDMVVTGAQDRPYQRKIYWIGPNLVVGWTGYLTTARVIVKDLLDNFNNQSVTKAQLESFLTRYKAEDLGSLDFAPGCAGHLEARAARAAKGAGESVCACTGIAGITAITAGAGFEREYSFTVGPVSYPEKGTK